MAGDGTRTGVAVVGSTLPPVRGTGGAPLLFDERRQRAFLAALRASCHMGRSAAPAGVSTGTVYARRLRDPVFDAATAEAAADGADRLRQNLLDRAIDAADIHDRTEAHDGTQAGDGSAGDVSAGEGGERPKRWLAARLGAVPGGRATAPRKAKRAIPRVEVDRRLLEAVERLARGLRS